MKSRIPFIKNRIAVNLAGLGSVACDVTVCWQLTGDGETDPGTGGNLTGTESFLSGTLRAFGHEEPQRNVVRQFAEIQAGDLILDLADAPEVALFPGQILSGTLALDELADHGLRYVWNGRWYTSKDVSPDLQSAWDAYVGNVRLHRTLLLKRAT